jgi:hypothetical protein
LVAPARGQEGAALEFSVSAEAPDDLWRMRFAWDFGDAETAVGPQVQHTYADNGAFEIRLLADDGLGRTFEATQLVQIENLAPRLTASVTPGDKFEGTSVAFSAHVEDTDEVTVRWRFGDGARAEGPRASHTYFDSRVHVAEVVATDPDGASTTTLLEVAIGNKPPVVVSTPTAAGITGELYSYTLVAEDAGQDQVRYELVSGPAGMAVLGDALTWVPNRTGQYGVVVQAIDDEGASAMQGWIIDVAFRDDDLDGAPDTCESAYGLNPADADDALADADLDGIDNRTECLEGTDPTSFNGPTPPGVTSPAVGSRVEGETATMTVSTSFDPDDDPLAYDFELYADESLTELIDAQGAIVSTARTVAWTPTADLDENATYWWRARANDSHTAGRWTAVAWFTVDRLNEPPTVPTAVSPVGQSETAWPTLILDGSTDPEQEQIAYLYEVYLGETDSGQPVLTGQSAERSWTVPTKLRENTLYSWKAYAIDDLGATSEASGLTKFVVNTDNDLPSAPTITSPGNGDVVATKDVEVAWQNAFDPDGDSVTYEVQVSCRCDFATIIYDRSGIPGDPSGTTRVVVDGLIEDSDFFVRVRGTDAQGAGQYHQVGFGVNAVNGAPMTPRLAGPADSERFAPGYVFLTFDNVEDPEGRDVTYSVSIYTDSELTDRVYELIDQGDYGDTTSVAFDAPAEAKTYYWTVVARDDGGAVSRAAGPWSFDVVVSNLPPAAPEPVAPYGDANLADELVFMVLNADDPDGDALTYSFEVYEDADLALRVWSSSAPQGSGGRTTVSLDTRELGLQRFYWLAYVTDARGERSAPTSTIEVALTGALTPTTASGGGGCAVTPLPTPASTFLFLPAFGLLLLLRRRNR